MKASCKEKARFLSNKDQINSQYSKEINLLDSLKSLLIWKHAKISKKVLKISHKIKYPPRNLKINLTNQF